MTIRNLINDLDERYFVWLCGLVVNHETEERLHASQEMMRGLFYEPFIDWVPNDDNRAAEGCGLRDRYTIETGNQLNRRLDMGQCSMLEMLVALAERFAWQVASLDETVEENIPPCFWVLVDNLKLNPAQKNLGKLAVLNKRTYAYNGTGGLFPLRHPKEDQRNVEIWYQMMAYLIENYEI